MSVSILMVRALIEAVERVGVDRDQLLAAVGLEPGRLDEYDARLSLLEYDRVQLAALELSRDEALGLHLGELSRSAAFDLVGHLTDHTTTLRQSVESIKRYSRILSDGPECTLYEEGEIASIRYAFPRAGSPGIRLAAELAMAGVLRLIRRFAGPDARPRGVFFAYPAPAYRAEYTRVFGGTEHFEHEFTGIEFERAWLDRTQLLKNPELYTVLQEQAERALGRLRRDNNLAASVREQLASYDPRKMPKMEEVARCFGMSARSLRRRLEAEGVDYRDLIKRTRAGMAKRLLENPRASIQEIAYAIGFSSPAGFHRAFKRWTGMTPKQYRSSY